MIEGVSGVRPAAVSLELRSDSGVMSHWKDYDRLAAFSFLSQETAAPFHRTSTDTVRVPMVPQVGEFRAGRVHQLNAQAVELPLQVSSSYVELCVCIYVYQLVPSLWVWTFGRIVSKEPRGSVFRAANNTDCCCY